MDAYEEQAKPKADPECDEFRRPNSIRRIPMSEHREPFVSHDGKVSLHDPLGVAAVIEGKYSREQGYVSIHLRRDAFGSTAGACIYCEDASAAHTEAQRLRAWVGGR
jgi:hypothetical protein